jgi:hypothetical protein
LYKNNTNNNTHIQHMVKLVDILNKDVGSLAAKVLKADVGNMVKGAGRALNTDVGTIAKGAGKVLSYDLGELFAADADADAKDVNAGAIVSASETPAITATSAAQAVTPNTTVASTTITPTSNATDTDTSGNSTIPRAKLTEALVNRQQHAMPTGSALLALMPLKIGAFVRPSQSAVGDIASDPVSVTYSSNVEALSLSLDACWDSDESIEKLNRRRAALENARSGADNTWVAGLNSQGIVFIWRREQYCFEIVSPRGVSPVARFLADFPY